MHGGYGYIKSTSVQQYMRDCRVHQILEGTLDAPDRSPHSSRCSPRHERSDASDHLAGRTEALQLVIISVACCFSIGYDGNRKTASDTRCPRGACTRVALMERQSTCPMRACLSCRANNGDSGWCCVSRSCGRCERKSKHGPTVAHPAQQSAARRARQSNAATAATMLTALSILISISAVVYTSRRCTWLPANSRPIMSDTDN